MKPNPSWALTSVLEPDFDRIADAEAEAVAHVRNGGTFDATSFAPTIAEGVANDARLPVLIAA
jgi:hypothetical protein